MVFKSSNIDYLVRSKRNLEIQKGVKPLSIIIYQIWNFKTFIKYNLTNKGMYIVIFYENNK